MIPKLNTFDFWTSLVHGSFDDSSYFVHVNINIFIWHIYYVWAACGIIRPLTWVENILFVFSQNVNFFLAAK